MLRFVASNPVPVINFIYPSDHIIRIVKRHRRHPQTSYREFVIQLSHVCRHLIIACVTTLPPEVGSLLAII